MKSTTSERLGPAEIKKLIPHRHPFLWIDAVEIVTPGLRAHGIKAVSISEEMFEGHFPSQPILPGVIIIEAMAQTGAVLLNHGAQRTTQHTLSNECGYLAKVDVKFVSPVEPGCLLYLDASLAGKVGNLFLLTVKALVNGRTVAEGKISVTHPAGISL